MIRLFDRLKNIALTPVVHGDEDRMAGVRFGFNKNRWYLRFDCWKKSFRLHAADRQAEHKIKPLASAWEQMPEVIQYWASISVQALKEKQPLAPMPAGWEIKLEMEDAYPQVPASIAGPVQYHLKFGYRRVGETAYTSGRWAPESPNKGKS